ncbi:MAG: hypothetical protein GY725_16145 [bacterium]|nr:hypothetical protein [bacterium]
MALAPNPLEAESPPDPAYPTTTPPDAVYPGQTRVPLTYPLDEIATPSMWSRLQRPIERSLVEIWTRVGLLDRARPQRWVTIHYGRISLNAHAWERMRARINREPPDTTLVEPPDSWLAHLPEYWEELRARLNIGRLERRLEEAERKREACLRRAAAMEFSDLDNGELARGPLDEPSWCEILLPWFGQRLLGEPEDDPPPALRAAVALEQRCGVELGRRLTARKVLESPAQVAFLTVEERIRAVHESSSDWAALALTRENRIENFLKFDLPVSFWGRPRIDGEKA